ncbi:MAG: TAXI family TRAP transporter solute-binding subunit [Pseudomonadota bacterium]
MFGRLLTYAPVILAMLAVIAAALAFVWFFFTEVLLPPDKIVMAAGREGGGYEAFAKRYRAILARDGIELEIIETAGSPENARLLAEGVADVAFIQGGTRLAEDAALEAIAAVFLEPFLVLHRVDVAGAEDPAQWTELRVAAGGEDSGTRAAVQSLMLRLGLSGDLSSLLPLGGEDAAFALRDNEIDVAIFVAPITAPYLWPLLENPDIAIRPIRDAEALARRMSFIRIVDIPRSGLDYVEQVPPERIELMAMVGSLVAQSNLHPAVVNRLVRAAQRVHGGPNLLSRDLVYPSSEGTPVPMDNSAAAALAGPPGFFERYLPYWIAAQITSVTVVLVPLIILLLPLLRATPGLLAWRLRARVYRNYTKLVELEQAASAPSLAEIARTDLSNQLDQIDREIAGLNLPARYREYAYAMRLHIDLVRKRLDRT